MISKNFFKVQKTARYFTAGTLSSDTDEIWIAFHGYGQLAEFFIKKLKPLIHPNTFLIVPEALNHFYLEGFSGRVGACWMTKDERASEITDYVEYIDALFNYLAGNIEGKDVKINVLGFSQGVATACRWAVEKQVNFDKLVLWAGIFPPDLNNDFAFSVESLSYRKIYVVYGKDDNMLKPEHMEELERMKQIKPDLKVLMFEGGHEINQDMLNTIYNDGSFPG